jgi:stage II sporulation protein D
MHQLSYSQEINLCLWKGNVTKHKFSEFQNKYGNDLSIRKNNHQSFIIQRIDLEEYLIGVLAKEMDSLWPIEALKAQAVLSRTFALYKIYENRNKKLPYDIENSIYHQVYRKSNCNRIKEAVYSTTGEVLTCNEEIAQVFFHANCGGSTTTPEEVWGGKYPLYNSISDPYCSNTPYYNWTKKFTKAQISKLINFSNLDKIIVTERDISGRVKNLNIISKNGKIMCVSAHKLRLQINSNASRVLFTDPFIIPGTNFTIRDEDNFIIFTGTGYGHGVGMCQWGARKMAEAGKNYIEILNYYFKDFLLKTYNNS